MNTQMRAAAAEATRVLAANPLGHLPLAERSKLWMSLGPRSYDPGYRARLDDGHVRRVKLCVISTEHSLPVWDELLRSKVGLLIRDEDTPRSVLASVQQRLDGTIGWDGAWKRVRRLGTMLQYAYEVPEHLTRAFLVANAAIATLGASVKDLPEHDPGVTDQDQDAWDPPFYACWAWCGAPPWGPQSEQNIEERNAYWRWFIHDAFPTAAACPRN